MTHPDWEFARDRLGLVDRPQQSKLFSEMLYDPRYVVGGEGSTGIGKSALVAPIALSGRRVVYTARSKAQQQQMAEFCDKVLLPTGIIDDWRLLYGRANYICLRRARDAGYWLEIREDGSRQHYPDVDDDVWWRINSNFDEECSRNNCGELDSRNRALDLAKATPFLITNHNVVCLSTMFDLIGTTQDRTLLVDEAHDLPGVISDTFGGEVSVSRLSRANAVFRRELRESSPLADAPDVWRATLQSYADQQDVLWRDQETAALLVEQAEEAVAILARQATSGLAPLPAMRIFEQLANTLKLLALDDADSDYARYVENARERNPRAMVRVLTTKQLAQKMFGGYAQTYVVSATLRGLPAQQLGLGEVHIGESPFDLGGRRYGYTVRRTGSDADNWDPEELQSLIRAVGGGHTLVLATSHTQKKRAADELKLRGFRVGMQGSQGSTGVTDLVNELKTGAIDVLVGTDALMTGIDIPGDALRLVVLLKWPVPAYKRPFEAAMSARLQAWGFNPWASYLDPLGELKARQAVGRLIRTVGDWGVVACLDPRYKNKRKFWELISPSNYSSNLADVENFASLFR